MSQSHAQLSRADFNLPPGVGVHDIPGNEKPFILVAAKRGHRPKFGRTLRVMMPGATVDTRTRNLARRWRGKTLSLGLLLDQLFAFAEKRGFKPDRSARK